MSALHVGIGELGVSTDPDGLVKTFALGSCVAVIAHDSLRKVAGLMHVALPDSSVNSKKADSLPAYFADTGMPVFLEELRRAGAAQVRMSIRLVGGASIMDEKGLFDIGKRNILAIRKLLWKHGLGTIAEDVGGSISRTVSVSVATGVVLVSSGGETWKL